MIQEKDIFPIGQTQKTHGIRGEVTLLFDNAEFAELDVDFYFLDMDGIPVPYFVEEYTNMTDVSARVKFVDVVDERSASILVNKRVLIPREIVKLAGGQPEDAWKYFIGFHVVDQHGEQLGSIEEVDDSTLNVLFVVVNEKEEHLIPATEDFIVAIDEDEKIIEMHLPEGLLEK